MASIKTAISLDESLFREVDKLAKEMKMPLGQVLVLAVEEFVWRHDTRRMAARINAAYEGESDEEDRAFLETSRHSLRRSIEEEGDAWE